MNVLRWFWRGLRARADRADAAWCARPVDQDDEDAWLRMAARFSHPAGRDLDPVDRLEASKAAHRRGLR